MNEPFGQPGWKEFSRNRKNILDEYDKIVEQTASRPVKVAHGVGVEAYIRKWLSEFIPKKYGVTSGYIIPDLYGNGFELYHFDIIIYDVAESPVLWTESNEDATDSGKSRAIPARYVVAVYEVKSRLTKKNVDEAIAKLSETTSFSTQLHRNFSSGIIFVELKQDDVNRTSILEACCAGDGVAGFRGGIVLRFEADPSVTGRIMLMQRSSDETSDLHEKPLARPIDDLDIYLTEDGNLQWWEPGAGATLVCTSPNGWHVSKSYGAFHASGTVMSMLSWSRNNFSEFCIELLSSLNGELHTNESRPTFGRVFDSIKRKEATPQPEVSAPGSPRLSAEIDTEITSINRVVVSGSSVSIEFSTIVSNVGDEEICVSDNGFKTSVTLAPGKSAVGPIKIDACPKEEGVSAENLAALLEGELHHRFVYRRSASRDDFFSYTMKYRIVGSEVRLV